MRLISILAMFILVTAASGCVSVKPYEKEYLLNPVMDDGQLGRLQSGLLQSASSRIEKLVIGGANSGSTSCPTCGG